MITKFLWRLIMSSNEKNEKITCRVAIQVCIGHFPDGRERHRTFSMKGVDPDASPEAIAAVVRALAPVLVYPITKVRKIVKRVILIFEEGGMPAEQSDQSSQKKADGGFRSRRVIPFSVPKEKYYKNVLQFDYENPAHRLRSG